MNHFGYTDDFSSLPSGKKNAIWWVLLPQWLGLSLFSGSVHLIICEASQTVLVTCCLCFPIREAISSYFRDISGFGCLFEVSFQMQTQTPILFGLVKLGTPKVMHFANCKWKCHRRCLLNFEFASAVLCICRVLSFSQLVYPFFYPVACWQPAPALTFHLLSGRKTRKSHSHFKTLKMRRCTLFRA